MATSAQMIEVNLNTPTTPDEIKFAKIQKSFKQKNETDECLAIRQQQLLAWTSTLEDDWKPNIRYFSVGPSSYQIRCPLCKQRADTETVKMSGILGDLSCLLSTLSCCFPIFSLSFIYLCLQSRLKSKRLFCNRCGGHLGYCRPT